MSLAYVIVDVFTDTPLQGNRSATRYGDPPPAHPVNPLKPEQLVKRTLGVLVGDIHDRMELHPLMLSHSGSPTE
jgi:hypothetical protein